MLKSLPLWLCLLWLTACGAPTFEPPEAQVFNLTTTRNAETLLPALTAAFSARQDTLFFEIDSQNSTQALRRLTAAQTNLALTNILPPNPEQFAVTPLARDGLILVTHPSTPLDSLTLNELRTLYQGRVVTWADVGGSAEAVTVAVRERDSGANTIFRQRVMAETPITLNARVFPSNQALAEFVAQTPGALGFVSLVNLVTLKDSLKVLAIEDIAPTPDNLSTGAYPLAYPLYLLTPLNPPPRLREFVNFAVSPAGQEIVARQGFGRIR